MLSHDNFFEMNPSLSRNGGPPERFEGESSAIVVEETIRFISKVRQSEKPFIFAAQRCYETGQPVSVPLVRP